MMQEPPSSKVSRTLRLHQSDCCAWGALPPATMKFLGNFPRKSAFHCYSKQDCWHSSTQRSVSRFDSDCGIRSSLPFHLTCPRLVERALGLGVGLQEVSNAIRTHCWSYALDSKRILFHSKQLKLYSHSQEENGWWLKVRIGKYTPCVGAAEVCSHLLQRMPFPGLRAFLLFALGSVLVFALVLVQLVTLMTL